MEQESVMTVDAELLDADSGSVPATARSLKPPGYRVQALYGEPEPPQDPPPDEPPLEEEEEGDEQEQQQAALVEAATNRGRLQAALEEVLRQGQAYGLVVRQADGRFAITGQTHALRDGSECACAQCTSYNQKHWYCVVCNGHFDWQISKPYFPKPRMRPGGVSGVLDASCSASCAKTYLELTQKPASSVIGRDIDPTLGLPGV